MFTFFVNHHSSDLMKLTGFFRVSAADCFAIARYQSALEDMCIYKKKIKYGIIPQ